MNSNQNRKENQMNRIAYLLVVALAGIPSCQAAINLKDYGPEITRKININNDITKITSNAVADIEYFKSSNGIVELIGPQQIVSRCTVKEKGSTVTIDCTPDNNNVYNWPSIRVRIGLPVISEFTGNGVGSFSAGTISTNTFTLNLMSVGNVDIKSIEAVSVKFNIDGVSNIDVGTIDCSTFDIMSNGIGSTAVKKVFTSSLHANQNGTGSISIDKLEASKVDANQTGISQFTLDNCDVVTLTASQTGTGVISLSGFASTAILTAEGVGYIDATNLKTDRIAYKQGDYAKINL